MKAILVIDMPKCCEECRLINSHYDNEYGWQTYCGADYHRIREKNKKCFCPLKPMPQKRVLEDFVQKDYFTDCKVDLEKMIRYVRARANNEIIDEILGETE